MQARRRSPPDAFRRLAAVAALLAQLLAATGGPVFARPANKPGGTPFPCQSHPCGCATSEQGWAGDCCCFTLEEKLAWADARGVSPPAHVRPAVAARALARTRPASCCAKRSAPACCEKPEPASKPAVRWVAGVFAQRCRGEAAGGLLKLDLLSVPADPPAPVALDPVDSVRDPRPRPTLVSATPPEPPPRLA